MAGDGAGGRQRARVPWTLREVVGLLPSVARLLYDVARDPRVPRRGKLVAAGAGVYLVSPIDVIPGFIPVLGQADDLTVVLWALRYLVRSAGYDVLRDLWRGTEEGFAMLLLVAGVEH